VSYIPIYLDQNTVLGRWEAGFGPAQEVGFGPSVEIMLPGILRRAALVGDVTADAGSNLTTIASDVVTFAKMQNVATDTMIGRASMGVGDLEVLVCTAAGRALLDDADAAAQRATLGIQIGVNVQPYDPTLSALASFNTNGFLVQTASDTFAGRSITGTAGLITILNGDGGGGDPIINVGANVYRAGGADVALADGGTGASDAVTARTNLGLTIGTNVQAYDPTLSAFAGYDTNGILTQIASDTFTGRTITGTAGLITITNGDGVAGNPTISVGANVYRAGGTDVAVADGGTGASDASTARTNLGLAIGVNVQAFDTELAALASTTSAANKLPYFTGLGTATTTDLTAFTRTLLDDADAATARATLGISSSVSFYQNQTLKANPRVWTAVTTTVGGVATFFPTDTNTAGGNALFTNIYAVQATAANNTSVIIQSPNASVKLISADKKTITVNVGVGVNLLVLAPTLTFAPDGTVVYLTVFGD